MPFPSRRLSICPLAVAVAITVLGASGNSQVLRPLRMDKSGINPTPESAASFDCTKAKLRVEQLICRNFSLAMADGEMGEQLWFLKRRLTTQQWADVIHSQRVWLQRRNACLSSKCLETAYEQRSRELVKVGNARDRYLRRNVSRVGQCEKTTVESIGPRLQHVEGEPLNGTSITFADAVRQVSYNRDVAVLASRVGDLARVCLIEIPNGCPPGDNRGRVYRVTNLRTGKTWELPDSSHECGGA
jgi:uncharacterized protein